MGNYLGTLNGAKASVGGYGLSLVKAKLATVGLQAASVALNAVIGFGIGLAITGAITLIGKLATAQQDAIDKANALTDAYRDSVKQISGDTATLEGLEDEFAALSRGVDAHGKNVSLTADEYKRYREIVAQILEISPALVKGYDAEGSALYDNNGLLEDAIRLQKELKKQKQAEYLLGGGDILKGARGELKRLNTEKQQIYDDIYKKVFTVDASGMSPTTFAKDFKGAFDSLDLGKAFGSAEGMLTYSDAIVAALRTSGALSDEEIVRFNTQIGQLKIKSQEMETVNGKVRSYLELWASSDTKGGEAPWYANIQSGYLDNFGAALKTVAADSSSSILEMQVSTQELGAAFLALQEQLPTETLDALSESFQRGTISEADYRAEVERLTGGLLAGADGNAAFAAAVYAVRDELLGVSSPAQDAAAGIAGIGEAARLTETELTALANALSLLDSAAQKAASDTALSTDEMIKLLEVCPELASAITFTADGCYLQADALNAARDAAYLKKAADLDLMLVEAMNRVQMDESSNGLFNLVGEYHIATSATEKYAAALAILNYIQENATAGSEELAGVVAQIGALFNDLNTLPTRSSGRSASSGIDKALQAAKKESQAYIKELQKASKSEAALIQKQIDAKKKAQEKALANIKKEMDAVKERYDREIDALRRVQEERDRQRDRDDIAEEIRYWEQRTGAEAVEKLAELRKELSRKEEDWALDDQISSLEASRDAELERLERREAKIKASYDAELAQLEGKKTKIKEDYDAQISYLQEISGGTDATAAQILQSIEAVKNGQLAAIGATADAVNAALDSITAHAQGGSGGGSADRADGNEKPIPNTGRGDGIDLSALYSRQWERLYGGANRQWEDLLATVEQRSVEAAKAISEQVISESVYLTQTLQEQYAAGFIMPFKERLIFEWNAANLAMLESAPLYAQQLLATYDAQFLTPFRDRLESILSDIRDAESRRDEAREDDERGGGRLRSSHTGSLITKSGIVNVQMGEVVIRRDIAQGLMQVVEQQKARVAAMNSYYATQNSVDNHRSTVTNVTVQGPLMQVERQEFTSDYKPDLAMESMARTLKRRLNRF